jgi:hypothetical protein
MTGRFCNFAHSEHVCVDSFTAAYDAYMSGEGKQNKGLFQSIFEECYASVQGKRDYINSLRGESGNLVLMGAIPEPIAENFVEIVKLWMAAAGMARKFGKADKFPLFDGCDSPMENLVWILARRVQTCTKDQECHFYSLIGSKIEEAHICVYGDACERGTHLSNCTVSGVSKRICVKNLTSIDGACDCKFTSAKEAESKRSELMAKLALLKQEREVAVAMKKSAKTITEQISKVADELTKCFYLTHCVGSNGFNAVSAIVEKKVDAFVPPTEADFARALPKMTEEQQVQYAKDQEAFRAHWQAEEAKKRKVTLAHRTLVRFYEHIKFGRLLKTLSPSSPVDFCYIATGAFRYMDKAGFVKDFQSKTSRLFLNWYTNSRTVPFHLFQADVKNKMQIWETMGVEKRVMPGATKDEDETIEEYCVPSDKDRFRGFWQWYYNVPYTRDTVVVGTAADLAEECPELFAEYREANPSFAVKFDMWIESDALHSDALKVLRDNAGIISFYSAVDYVRMKVEETGMSVADFVTYNRRDVAAWIAVNKDRKLLRSEAVTMADFLASSDKFAEFYSMGMWRIYKGDFSAYVEEKKAGWQHVPLTHDLESASKLHEKALELLEAKEAVKKAKAQKASEMVEKFLKGDYSIFQQSTQKLAKESKPVAKSVAKSVAKKQHDSDDSDDSDTDDSDDSDSDFTVDFTASAVFPTGEEFFTKPKKEVPLNCKMNLGRAHQFYIHRHQEVEERDKSDAVVRTISIGPFRTEEQACTVMLAVRAYNKSKGCRGMKLRVVSTPGDVKSADCWDVCYGDTVVGRFEKSNSYDWMCDLIVALSKSTLPGTTLASWTTNIDNLRNQIAVVLNKESASSQLKAPSKSTTVVAPMAKSVKTKRTAEDIRKEKEEKAAKKIAADEARKAEAAALAAKKLAEKAIVKSKTKVEPVIAPNVKGKAKAAKLVVDSAMAVY